MRIRSQRLILLTPFATPPNPGGIIIPDPISTTKRVSTARDIVWDMEDDSEVTGTVEINRSILWDVQEESGPELVNYIEVPFFQWNWEDDVRNPGSPFDFKKPITEFTGLVRLWESGTIQFVGAVRSVYEAHDYRAGTGIAPNSATLRIVGTPPAPTVWGTWGAQQAVDWSYKLAAGENFYVHVESPASGISQYLNVPALAYPGGWQFPLDIRAEGDTSAYISGTVSRSGDDLSISGSRNVGTGFAPQFGLWSREMDISTWTLQNQTNYLSGPTAGPFGPFTRTIPDSATVGMQFDLQLAMGAGFSAVNSLGMFGPIFRPAYSTPTIQQGVDPIP